MTQKKKEATQNQKDEKVNDGAPENKPTVNNEKDIFTGPKGKEVVQKAGAGVKGGDIDAGFFGPYKG